MSISLREELATEAYAGMDATQMLALVNTKSILTENRKLVPLWQIKKICIETGVWIALRMASVQVESVPLAHLAATVMEYINDVRFENLDMDLVSTQQMIGALVQSGVMTSDQSALIDDMANVRISPAIQILGREANDVDVYNATNHYEKSFKKNS
jgi:hypothetical protein